MNISMPRTYRRRKSRKIRKSRKGGNYYPYNRNPLLFTDSSNQLGGWAGDPRSTLFPDLVTNMARSAQYSTQSSINSLLGKSTPVNPIVTSQPINK
jgi:hypothetical protein